MAAERLAPAMVVVLLGAAAMASAAPASAPVRRPATLSVWRAGAWQAWWSADRAPERWTAADSTLSRALTWSALAPGLEWAEARLACGAPTWRARLIVARLDPRLLTLSLVMDLTRGDQRPAWTIDRAPADARMAVNAGQFVSTMPWGWVVIDGRQRLEPGLGPLSSRFAIDAGGHVRWAHGDSARVAADVVTGFQSYPTLIAGDGLVPPELRSAGHGVSPSHRDARLALGETRDGHVLIALTRYDVLGEVAQTVPLGPTTPEMAAIMGALGACDAVMLDGGISAQLLLRGRRGRALRWPGLRKVPLALIARARAPAEGGRAK